MKQTITIDKKVLSGLEPDTNYKAGVIEEGKEERAKYGFLGITRSNSEKMKTRHEYDLERLHPFKEDYRMSADKFN